MPPKNPKIIFFDFRLILLDHITNDWKSLLENIISIKDIQLFKAAVTSFNCPFSASKQPTRIINFMPTPIPLIWLQSGSVGGYLRDPDPDQ